MDLKWLLVRRIALVALACLLVGSAVAVYTTVRAAIRENDKLADLVNRQLNLQLSRIARSTDIPNRFPDWDLVASLSLQPGQCIRFLDVNGAMGRSSCTGADAASIATPRWFQAIYEALTSGNQTSERTVYGQGVARGTVVVDYSPVATGARAWATVAPLIGFAAALVSVLCLVSYVVIDRALRPTRQVLSGLNRLASGDLTFRLPSFRLAELDRISQVFNELSDALRKATTERAELARRLVDTQEQERRHVARELHDEIAQKLSALSANVACLRTRAQREAPALAHDARELEIMASGLMVSVRRTLTYLRPQEIDDLGLVPSLEDLVAEHNRSAKGCTTYSIETSGDVQHLKAETSAHVYRIIQEGLTNASKHANARNVQVSISQVAETGPETIRLSIVDDGAGPDPDHMLSSHAGTGMIGMRERVVALSGTFVAGPLPSGGFSLQVEFPTQAAQ
jgi:two-component system, NarL family, sensor histidine kinase UhpB